MKKIFSFLIIFLISLLSVLSSYGLDNINFRISNNEIESTYEKETDDAYIKRGYAASFEVYNQSTHIYDALIIFNNYQLNNGSIDYYFTIQVTSFEYVDLTGMMFVYNTESNSLIGTLPLFSDKTIGKDETASMNIMFSLPAKDRIKIRFEFGPKSNINLGLYSPYVYPVIDVFTPTIDSFNVNDSNTNSNSISVNWNINDQYGVVKSIQIWDGKKGVMLKQVNSITLIANNYVIDGLSSNTNYNLELRVHWSDSTSGQNGDIQQSALANTNAQVPTVDTFSLVSTTNSSAIIQIKYSDPDNVVDKITIHDKKGKMKDVELSPSDLVNNEYELKNIKSGNYQLELTLHWTSLNDSGNVTYNEFIEFEFQNTASLNDVNAKWIYIVILLLLIFIIILLILLILYLIRRNKNDKIEQYQF